MRKLFTDEEIIILDSNPYTRKVTPTTIKFNDAFKDAFWTMYLENLPIRDIFRNLGFDPDILGTKRIEGFTFHMRKERLTEKQRQDSIQRYSKVKRPPENTDYSSMPEKIAIQTMQTELKYLRQEVEFLKKIYQLGTTTKSKE